MNQGISAHIMGQLGETTSKSKSRNELKCECVYMLTNKYSAAFYV